MLVKDVKVVLTVNIYFFFWQLGTLGELQRLYDELVESADACKLDRYSSSEKSGR